MKPKIAIRAVLCMLLVVLVLSVLPSSASADSTVTFTSTADFDAGTKSDPGAPFFATNGVSQPMNYINYPSAQYYNGVTYVTYGGSVDYLPYVTAYNHATGTWSGPVVAINSNPIAGDGHGSPALLVDASGYIHIFCCSHSNALKHARSTNPQDISTWTAMSDPDVEATYPHPLMYGSTMYLFYRGKDFTPHRWVWKSSTDGGATWSAFTAFIDLGADTGRVYLTTFELFGSKVYFSFNYEKPAAGGRINLYAAYLDIATFHTYAVDGTDLGTTIDLTEANANLRIEDNDPWQINAESLHLTPAGLPYILYRSGTGLGTGANWGFNFTRWTGSAWTAPVQIRSADGPEVLSGGGSGNGDFIVNTASDIEAYLIGPGERGRGGDIERWTSSNSGASWTKDRTILSQRLASLALETPMIVKGFNPTLKVVFETQHIAGASDYGFRPEEQLYAWGSAGFVYDKRLSYGYRVETVTDDGTMASGAFQLSSGLGDTFVHADVDGNTTKWTSLQWVSSGQETISRCDTKGVSSGSFHVSVTTDVTVACVLSSRFTVSGDFDVRVKTATPVDGSNRQAILCILDIGSTCQTTDNTLFQSKGFYYRNLIDGLLAPFNVTSGTETQIGTNSDVRTVDPICLRITRATNLFTFYYSTSPTCASWVSDESITRSDAPSSFNVMLVYVNNGATDGTGDFDDFQVVAGTINGYQTAGSWTSATQTFTSDVPRTVTVNYTGASASGYIDSVAIVDASGNVLYKDDTDSIAGTTATITVPASGNLRKNWAVRIVLAGDGSASPTVTNIDVAMGIDPTCFSASNGGSLVLSMLPILIGIGLVLAIVAAMKLRQEHHESGIDLTGIIVVGVSSVVIFVVLSVVYPLVTTLGNGAGC